MPVDFVEWEDIIGQDHQCYIHQIKDLICSQDWQHPDLQITIIVIILISQQLPNLLHK